MPKHRAPGSHVPWTPPRPGRLPAPKIASEASKTGQDGLQERPRYLQNGVGEVQHAPKMAHERSTSAQYAFKQPKRPPKRFQRRFPSNQNRHIPKGKRTFLAYVFVSLTLRASKTAPQAPKIVPGRMKRLLRAHYGGPSGLQDSPKSSKTTQQGPQRVPKGAQEGPKTAQGAPKRAPRWPKRPPMRPQEAPRGPNWSPRGPQQAPKRFKNCPQKAPKRFHQRPRE